MCQRPVRKTAWSGHRLRVRPIVSNRTPNLPLTGRLPYHSATKAVGSACRPDTAHPHTPGLTRATFTSELGPAEAADVIQMAVRDRKTVRAFYPSSTRNAGAQQMAPEGLSARYCARWESPLHAGADHFSIDPTRDSASRVRGVINTDHIAHRDGSAL